MRKLKLFSLLMLLIVGVGHLWATDVVGTINFGSASGRTAVNSTSVTGEDSQGNEWTITTVMSENSFTQNAEYSQVGASKKPATSITFTTTLPAEQTIKSFSAKFGGFSGTAGTVTLKVGETSVGTGSLNATNDVTVNATNTTTSGTVLTVTVTGISKGVKCYYISYTYDGGGAPDPVLESIVITGNPDKVVYEAGESFDPTGLVATGYYDNLTDVDITSSVTWAYTPAGALTQGLTSVNVTATSGNVVGNKDVNITVNEHTVTPGEYSITFCNAFFGTSGLNGSLSGANLANHTGSQNDITVEYQKGTGSNMYLKDSEIRLYKGNVLVITAPAGYNITSITGLKNTITASEGTMSGTSWSGNVNSVSFSHANSTGNSALTTITVTYDVAGAAPACTAPTITTQPEGATYMQNDVAAALAVVADACTELTNPLTYQWYCNTTASNEGGTVISGANEASYTPSAGNVGVLYYYCVVMQGDASVTSDAVAVSVEGPEVGVGFEKEEADYTDWTFNDIVSQQDGDITAHTKSYYGTTHSKAAASMVTANTIAGPDQLIFYVSKTTKNNTESYWYVKVSSDGTDWSLVETQDAISMSKGEWVEVTADLSDYTNVYVGIFYEGSTAIRAIDDVILTTRSLASYPVTYNANPANGLLSVELNSGEIASGTDVTEGDVLDVILAADEGYIGSVTVTKTDGGNNVTEDVYNAATGKLTMPAYGITVTAAFVIGVEAPVFDVASGVYTSEQLILLTTATSGASIYYTMTTDGTTPEDPTTASTLYNATTGIELNARGTYKIKAIAHKDENYSTIASAEYTINLPYVFATVDDLFAYVTDNALTDLEDVTVTGVVSKIVTEYSSTHNNVSFDMSDNGQTTGNQLRGYRTTGNDAAVVSVGDKVTLHGNYTLYNNATHELATGNTIEAYTAKVLSSVTVGGTAVKTEYSANETFDFEGLTATANYSNTGYSAVIESADLTWATDLAEDKVTETATVHVTATYNQMTSAPYDVAVTVSTKELVSIALDQSAYTVYKGAALPQPAVTATYTEGDPADVSVEAVYDTENVYDNTTADVYTITVGYTFGATTKTAQYTVTVQEYANADDAPYTVTKALEIITNAVGSTESADEIVVAGTVSVENKDGYKNRYKISDGTNELLIYNGKGFNKANFTNTNYPKVGDVVVVKGNVINYNGNTPEFATGKSYLLSQIRPVMLSIDNVTAFEVGTADMEEGDLTIDRGGSTGEITFASEDETVVTIVEGKLHAVAPGMAVITANMAATANEAALNYAAVSTTFNVTVVGTLPRYAVTFTANGGMGDAPVVEDQLEGAVFNLPANTFTYAGHKFAGWNDGTNTYAAGAAYTMPAAAVAFTAQWEDVCAWATVYTSNVVFTGAGTSFETGSRVVIGDEEFEAQKVGASSKSGSVVVTVPAGAHTLHFHAVSWNTSDLTITASGVSNMTQSSFDIKKDAGVKSSGTYILANDPIDQHFHFTFDPVAEPTEITFSKTTGSDYRFVMYGINQEGGPELKSLTIGGTPTTTAYEVGQSFSTDGLTVSAVYALGGVDQEPVDVTDQVTWNINPTEFTLTSQTSVTVTASLETKTATKTVDVTVSAIPDVREVAIVVKKGDTYYAMSQTMTTSNSLKVVEIGGVFNGKMINVPLANRPDITWRLHETASGTAFQAQSGDYLASTGADETDLAYGQTPYYWHWNAEKGCYIDDNNRALLMRYYSGNPQNSEFKNFKMNNYGQASYSSSSELFDEFIDIDADKEFVVLREGLTVGQLGTFCWQADIYEIEGAVFYEPEEKMEDGINFIESLKEGDVFPMGKPYLFQAEATEIRGLVSKTNTTDIAGDNHGMHGTFTDIVVNDPDIMIVNKNKVRPSAGNLVSANRAYIVISELPAQADPTPAPGRRRLVLGREDAPTAIDNILMDAQNVQKVLFDGQLYIVREGKWYDVTGQQVR